jgi:DNA-binding transcriptional ArsR family regulator
MFNPMVEHARLVELDATYGALAHPVRREMIRRLRAGEALVTELAEPFDISLAAASKHIRVLESAGLIRRSVRGREHRLSLDPGPLGGAADWIEENRRAWEARLDALDARLRGGRWS